MFFLPEGEVWRQPAGAYWRCVVELIMQAGLFGTI
jgi:hypothetical protein